MSGGRIIIYKTIPPGGLETVEKKGLGHPDAICDALAERISSAYARYCYENFDHTLIPYTIDGLTMDEGESKVEFGAGEMLKPIRLYLRGNFAAQFQSKKIPYMDVAKKTIYEYLEMILPKLDTRRWLRIIDATQAYGGPRAQYKIDELVANHMYTVSATYPPSPTENCALRIEQQLNSPIYKQSHPYIGADNKIIVVQNGNKVDIASYVSMISDQVPSADDLRANTETIKEDIRLAASTDRVKVEDIDVYTSVNPLHDGRVMTVTGSSIESYNGGAVGRSRYPVYHAAKIYAVVAYQIAKRIYNEEKVAACVKLTSKVGWPMSSPWRTDINLYSNQATTNVSQQLWKKVEEIAKAEFEKIEEVVKTLMYSKTNSF